MLVLSYAYHICPRISQKKMIAAQRKEVKEQKDEATEFSVKQLDLNGLKARLYLLRILHAREEAGRRQRAMTGLREDLDRLAEAIKDGEAEVVRVKAKLAKTSKSSAQVEKEVAAQTKARDVLRKSLIQVEERVKTLNRRRSQVEKSQSSLQHDQNAQLATLARLTAEIDTLVGEEESLRASLRTSSEGPGSAWDEDTMREYLGLKEEAVCAYFFTSASCT